VGSAPAYAASEASEGGNYTYLNPFAHKPATEQGHWDYAQKLRKKGKESAALKQFEIFTKRWPKSLKLAEAQLAIGNIYYNQKKFKKAFDAYEILIQRYYTAIRGYDQVLNRQLMIAQNEADRRRMAWLFGGYTSPKRAVPYFESILQNAPQWERAPELQYRIGQAYFDDEDYAEAVAAFTAVEYRYPESPFAEKAAFEKVNSLRELVRKTPNSLDIREEATTAAKLFPVMYPDSENRSEVERFYEALRTSSARMLYEIGSFYERVPEGDRTKSALVYYRKIINEYGGTDSAELAADRLRVLLPVEPSAQPAEIKKVVETPAETEAEPVVMTSADLASEQIEEDYVPPELPERMAEDPEAIEVTADRMEYQGTLLVAEGNVAIQQEGASLRADRVQVDYNTGEVRASGHVVFLRENTIWKGSDLVYNYKTKEGDFGRSSIYFDPVYITAEETKRLSDKEFLMRDAHITTCTGDKPVVYAKAGEVRVVNDDHENGGTLIHAKRVTFYIRDIPVFYVPVWKRHLGYRMFSSRVGHGSRFGFFIQSRMTIHPTDWLSTTTHLDYYTDRGVGLGQDLAWTVKETVEDGTVAAKGSGYLQTYYISDDDPYDSLETVAEQALVNSDRYRVKLGHQQELDDETYFITKIDYHSDPYVLEDFFRDEFRTTANPENYAVVQRSTDEYAAGLRVDKRLNDPYTTVDRFPELDFDWYRSALNGSNLYFENKTALSHLKKQYGEIDRVAGTAFADYDSVRFDTYNQLFVPMRVNEYYTLIPRAGYRGTWYSDKGAASEHLRHSIEAGAMISTKAYKTLTEKSRS
jgi:TolA-binding protein/lipopolysaccharide export system protein LptA